MIRKAFLEHCVPVEAVAYCEHLLANSHFDFLISRPRRTRLGDFTVKKGVVPRITVNSNLNTYNFLITYLHEVAHYQVHVKYQGVFKKRLPPHGNEWKQEFNLLLQPVLSETIFPCDILIPLKVYSLNPKASTGSDPVLYNALKKYDDPSLALNKTALIYLSEGTNFVFQNRLFVRGGVRRTRVLCTDKISKRRYTIPAHALVETC